MGGAVSSGRDNNELVDNLMSGNYIRTRAVERVFRALDRADYMSAEARDQAYKDLAWRNGPLHLSAPCIYSEVMEALELKPGLSFLNIGSGTGYLSTLVGLIIGSAGISHGVEASPAVYDYANVKLSQFIENCVTLDEFDFCMPKYYTGNGLCLTPHAYDRVYCGAGVVAKYENYFKKFIKVGGVLVMPLADQLVQLRRVSAAHWTRRNLLNVSFAHLTEPALRDRDRLMTLEEQCPPPLAAAARAVIRSAMRAGVMRRDAELREPPPLPAQPRPGPRRICIPYDATSDEELNELHDLDEAGGAHEMNALLSLVLSMGQNRAAGSLRFEHEDEPAEHEHQEAGEEGEEAPPAADDGFVVFDVGVRSGPPGGGVVTRRRARAPRPAPPAPGPGAAPAGSSAAPADSSAAPAESSAAPADSGAAPANSSAAPTDSSAAPADSSAAPADSSASSSSGDSRAAGADAAPAPRAEPRAAPRHRAPPRTFWSDLSSSEDDTAQVKDNKRQKLDSGIGENTVSSGASPDKSDEKTGHTHSSNTEEDDGDTDMPWVESEGESASSGAGSESEGDSEWEASAPDATVSAGALGATLAHLRPRCRRIAPGSGRRRGGRGARARFSRPSESDSGAEEGAGAGAGARRARGGVGGDARRVRLSLAMKRAVKELPLPHALKKYVNYNRCYEI